MGYGKQKCQIIGGVCFQPCLRLSSSSKLLFVDTTSTIPCGSRVLATLSSLQCCQRSISSISICGNVREEVGELSPLGTTSEKKLVSFRRLGLRSAATAAMHSLDLDQVPNYVH